MNIKDYYERIYNYTHGLTESAESQTNDSIQHSAKGDEWDKHKYLRKEYLGNGNWKYIYQDGTSNVTTAANEAEADAKEDAYQTSKAQTSRSNFIAQGKATGNASIAQKGREAEEKSGQQALKNEMKMFAYNTAQAGREAAMNNSSKLAYTPTEMAQNGRQAAINNSSSLVKTPIEMAQGGREAAINNSSSLVKNALEMAQKGREAAIANSSGLVTNPLEAAQKGREAAIANSGSFIKEPSNRTGLEGNSAVSSIEAQRMASAANPVNVAQSGREAAIAKSKLNETRQERYGANMANKEASIENSESLVYTPREMGVALNEAQAGREAAINNSSSLVKDPLEMSQQGREAAAAASQNNYKNMLNQERIEANTADTVKAKEYADKYMLEMENIYDLASRAGLGDRDIFDLISTFEKDYGGQPITTTLKDLDPDDVQFSAGSGATFEHYYNDVLPKVKEGINKALVSHKLYEFEQSLTPEQLEIFKGGHVNASDPYAQVKEINDSLKKQDENMVDSNVTTWDNVSTQTWDNAGSVNIEPDTWYNSSTGEFVTGSTEASDNAYFKAMRESFYNTTLTQLKANPQYTKIYSEEEIEQLARKYTNSFIENAKLSANK